MEKTVNFAVNYVFTKATDETLAKIYAEAKWIFDWKSLLNWRGKLLKNIQKQIPDLLRNYKGKHLNEIDVKKGHNIVPAVLRNELASLISGNTVTPTFKANYIAIWTGSTTPANTDTKLETEVLRATFTNRFSVDNIAYLDKFFSTAEVSWLTINECGVFVDWTASADTGFLLSRILMNETMASNETLTVNATFSIV